MFANAGISGGMANLFDTDVALITEVLRVNLIGPFLAIKHAAPKIAERGGGAIVLTASVAGIRSGAGSPAYSASKAGVINLAMVSAQQLSGSNVRVNAICPGLTETGMTKPTFDYAREAGKTDRIGRLTLDSCVMDGKTLDCGAVAGLEHIRSASAVARPRPDAPPVTTAAVSLVICIDKCPAKKLLHPDHRQNPARVAGRYASGAWARHPTSSSGYR